MRLVSAVEHLACTGISGVPRILEQGGTSTISGFSGEKLLMSKKTSSCEAPVLWTSFIAHIHTTYPSPTQPELLNGFALFPGGLVPVWIGAGVPPVATPMTGICSGEHKVYCTCPSVPSNSSNTAAVLLFMLSLCMVNSLFMSLQRRIVKFYCRYFRLGVVP